ncbi:response regulator transcription factor, partial [Hydrogenivirga sp. 128-5-R1-1]|uniref:response regulator transcription factor n=1 Tax=Hydrogenivirga sp. 128-5-R1-1 TaxID=392423 RepID=UPI00015F17C7
NNFLTDSAFDGEEALDYIENYDYNIIILDIMLPKIDGFRLCEIIRKKNIQTPILMLTAKSATQDKVKGLNIGADDYLSKPFDMEELIARVKALIRRSSTNKSNVLKINNYTFDIENRIVYKNGKKIELTPKLFCILQQLLINRGKIVSYDALMNRCWDITDYPTKETVRANIKLLRKLLEDKDLIKNIPGVGYKIE